MSTWRMARGGTDEILCHVNVNVNVNLDVNAR
jgi:hypothetical protein